MKGSILMPEITEQEIKDCLTNAILEHNKIWEDIEWRRGGWKKGYRCIKPLEESTILILTQSIKKLLANKILCLKP